MRFLAAERIELPRGSALAGTIFRSDGYVEQPFLPIVFASPAEIFPELDGEELEENMTTPAPRRSS